MEHKTDIEYASDLGFDIQKFEEEYILESKIHPALYITEGFIKEVNRNLVLIYDDSVEILRVIFLDTRICIKIDYINYKKQVIASDYTLDWFHASVLDKNNTINSILIDKYGEVTLGNRQDDKH